MYKSLIISSIALTILFISTNLSNAKQDYPYKKGKYLYFQGIGETHIQTDNKTQMRSLCSEAAILDAKAKMVYYVDELRHKRKKISVKAMKGKYKKYRYKVKAVLKRAEIVRNSLTEENKCEAILRINRKKLFRKLKVKESKISQIK